jgi:hypothetical protein
MPKADVLQLVADLTNGLADQTNASQIYSDLITELGRDSSWTMVRVQAFAGVAGEGDYQPSALGVTDIVDILSVLYDGRHLARSDVAEAKYYDRYFRVHLGRPRVWIEQDAPREGFQLYPIPSLSSVTAGPYDPTTHALAEGDVVVVYTHDPSVLPNCHLEEELAVALEVVAREMSRDSDHTDKTLAQIARTLSGMLFQMVGIGNTLAGLDETGPEEAGEPTPAGAP